MCKKFDLNAFHDVMRRVNYDHIKFILFYLFENYNKKKNCFKIKLIKFFKQCDKVLWLGSE